MLVNIKLSINISKFFEENKKIIQILEHNNFFLTLTSLKFKQKNNWKDEYFFWDKYDNSFYLSYQKNDTLLFLESKNYQELKKLIETRINILEIAAAAAVKNAKHQNAELVKLPETYLNIITFLTKLFFQNLKKFLLKNI